MAFHFPVFCAQTLKSLTDCFSNVSEHKSTEKKLVNQAKILSAITNLLKHEKYVQRKS